MTVSSLFFSSGIPKHPIGANLLRHGSHLDEQLQVGQCFEGIEGESILLLLF